LGIRDSKFTGMENKKIESYKDLIVWQKRIELVNEIYVLTKRFPKEEMFGLSNQMRRASVSIPANIAEGWDEVQQKVIFSLSEYPVAHYMN
jgi:hypothetical protein